MASKKKQPLKNLGRNIKAAKAAVKQVTKAVESKKDSSKIKSKRSYTLRELPIKNQATYNKYITAINEHAADLEKLRKPGEQWVFTFFGGRSHQVFDSIDGLINYTSKYQAIQQYGNSRGKHGQELIENLKLIKFGGKGINVESELNDEEYEEQVGQYQKSRKRQVAKRAKEKQHMEKEITETVEKVTGSKPRTRFDAMAGLLNINKALSSQLDAMNKRLAELEKELKGGKKKSKKTAKKKNVKTQNSTANKQASTKKGSTKAAVKKGATNGKGTKQKGTVKKAVVSKNSNKSSQKKKTSTTKGKTSNSKQQKKTQRKKGR